MVNMSYFSYFRPIMGFIGITIIAGNSVFLFQNIYQDRYSEPDFATFALFVINTTVFCVIAWKIFKNYKNRL